MQDLRDAIRALRAAPIVSAVAILSLALGIGANTAIFSIVPPTMYVPMTQVTRNPFLTSGTQISIRAEQGSPALSRVASRCCPVFSAPSRRCSPRSC